MVDFTEENWLEKIERAIITPDIVPSILVSDGALEMKMFIDCEYNSMGGQLLSMALVPEDTQFEPLYRELVVHEPIDEWVRENVLMKMSQCQAGTSFVLPLTRNQFQSDLILYLNQYDRIHIVADWPDDIKYFCDVLITGPGARIDTPPLTMEIRRDLDCTSQNPHHALADALAMRDKYLSVALSGK